MLHKLKSTYGDIAKYFPELSGRLSATGKKQLLLKMAKKGEPRPCMTTRIGQALSSYTRKSQLAYDPKFDKEIRQIRKDWFITPTEKVNQKKQVLLEMAKKGEPKPHIKTPLGRFLSSQTIKSSHSYNPSFDGQIKKINPDWFVTEKVNSKKQTLLEMARRGEPRPLFETSLGRALLLYTRKDPKFNKDIKKVRPDWLVTQTEQTAQNKQALIKMARKGEPKPHFKTHLGYKLFLYTRKSSASYDPKFDKEIRQIRKDWLITPTEKVNENKKLLLEMARRGETKPERKYPLGRAFSRYTIKSSYSYDPKFTRDIRKIRPDWLLSNPEKTNHRKKLLLQMARNGKPRPTQKTSLGGSFCQYTRKSSASYDPKFTKDIRKIRPDWLVTQTEKVNEKKKLLLEMARMGKKKPSSKTPLGHSLNNYMSKSSGVYDSIFTKDIKKIAPKWLKKCSTK